LLEDNKVTGQVSESSERFGLKINEKKTKTMPRGKEDMELNMSLDGNKLEQVKEFVYLGSQITKDATNDQDAKRRSRVWSSVIS